VTEAQFLAFVAYMFVWSGVITVILRDSRRIRRGHR